MSFTAFTNIITILFCIAVLVQSVRMMRSLNQVRGSQLDRTVGALDTATASARSVLAELKQTLSTDGAANVRTLNEAKEVREELNVMVGIANAMAERLIEAASAGSRTEDRPAEAPAKKPAAARSAKRTGTTARKAEKTPRAPKAKAEAPAATADKKPTAPATATPAPARGTAKPSPKSTAKPAARVSRKPSKTPDDAKEMA
ncbi:DUF6468 domain-containing protein [Alteriqipengyuania sp. 357]